jgi:hypothetical protein
MVTSLGAPTIVEVDKMNSVGVDDGKGLSTGLGPRT